MSGLLTTDGVRQLYQDTAADAAIRLQVLGVYRYLADPALKKRLGQHFADARDVFDVLLSDGRHKIKAVLATKCHKLVWTREVTARSLIRVTKFKVFMEDKEYKHRVVLLQDVVVTSLSDDGILPDKVVARRYGSRQADDQLKFISTTHPREVDLLPLVGERLYYLPMRSDHYTLDWACSFTGGQPDEDSPLDELESNWPNRYGMPTAGNEPATSSVAWNIVPDYCSDLFTPECKKLHTILEALDKIKKNNRQGIISNLNPPMLGAIRVKSKVLNLGDPNISNPFPFAFNAVVVDATGVFEVMFFGAMCAKYYLSLHEGDLLSFRGYSSVNPRELQWMATTSPLVSYPNDSSGIVYHVPKKYWKFLELAKIAPRLLADASLSSQQPGSWHLHQLCPSWLECNFVTTLNTQYWGKNAGDLDAMYFDFVGVLSNVGRICRKRKLDEGSSEVTEYRWIKMIDSSSSHELVIKLAEYSQPAVFRSLEAGNTLMITKLQWVILPDKRIQYAKTSTFSVLRMNEAVIPFHSLEECSLNVYFANNVNKNAVLASRKALGESKLSAHIEKKYQPRNRLPTSTEEFKEAFNLDVCSFSDLSMLLQRMEAFEHRHVGFIGHVRAVSNGDDPAQDGPSVLLQLNETTHTDQLLTVAVSINALYQRPAVKGSVKSVTPPKALPLIRLLPTAVVDEMYTKSFNDGPARSTRSKMPTLSLEFVEEYLVSSERGFFFSLQLYRDGIGHVTWEVDAILALP
ncbi:hypothetical protein L917_02322 [Phytophthora nicotianae]|uniref:Uncharacterized protein n=3 Tax=Phytophthora nicotianae TaxID=4792 RepID=V9FT63_PHYNI|nr:hypothetical protein F443_02546 [Phytophthora nicotianae P1569]ETK94567.1 hypothetical protein L915_02421 [Phytophthora nicotianae]ETM01053.1 hypothetical protein L917_02322 [Phytophthora nicotianae]